MLRAPIMENQESSGDHLCVLVHGLWGNPNHMGSCAKALREKYPNGPLHILVAKRNSGSFTYDGIELGGERVCQEIEEEIEALGRKGQHIKKLSIVGYSLGGLVARYAIGLLDSKGWFEKVEPVNFTTFASPHLGVRTPLKGYHNHIWNILGARTLSMSGRQLFTIDNFRNTSRPLLAVLADPDSIFIRGLAKFQRRTLYTNIVNDRSAVHYTTGISKTDPFVDLTKIKINYLPGYDDVLIDPKCPIAPQGPDVSNVEGFWKTFRNRVLFGVVMTIFIPIGIVFFFLNSVVQSFRSKRRIKLHETGRAGIDVGNYRMPLFITDGINEVRTAVEDVYENINSAQSHEYLGTGSEDGGYSSIDVENMVERPESAISTAPLTPLSPEKPNLSPDSSITTPKPRLNRSKTEPLFPTLALAPYQFEMIAALDSAGTGKEKGFRKFPVHIHESNHSHAAIIVRVPEKESLKEGWQVFRHWLEREFLV